MVNRRAFRSAWVASVLVVAVAAPGAGGGCTNPLAETRPDACARVADCTIGFTREMTPGVDAEALYGSMRTLPYGPADEPGCVDVITRLRSDLIARGKNVPEACN